MTDKRSCYKISFSQVDGCLAFSKRTWLTQEERGEGPLPLLAYALNAYDCGEWDLVAPGRVLLRGSSHGPGELLMDFLVSKDRMRPGTRIPAEWSGRVHLPKGSLIRSGGPRGDFYVKGTITFKPVDFFQGNIPGENLPGRNPHLRWQGEGRFWHYCDLNDVPEILEWWVSTKKVLTSV